MGKKGTAVSSRKASLGKENDGKQPVLVEHGVMTPEVLWSMGRVTDLRVSPDGKNVLYGVQYFNIPQNKSSRNLYVVPVSGGNSVRLTQNLENEQEATWSVDGKDVYLLSSESGLSQLWKMHKNGKNRKRLTNHSSGIDAFSFSPDGKKLLFVSKIPYGNRVGALYPDLPLAGGKIMDDLMYKHWDEWVETVPHPFVADLTEKGLENVVDLLEGEPYECPMKPFGGIQQLAWSPDGKSIAYSCRKKTGREYALSTNSDIYLYDLETKKTRNLTEGMMGYDTHPVFSPCGQYLAFQSMERDGYESDLERLFVHNLKTGENRCLCATFDGDVHSICWASDGKTLYFLSALQAVSQIFVVNIEDGHVRQLTDGMFDFESLAIAGVYLVALRHSLSCPNDVWRIHPVTGEMVPLTCENKEILDQLVFGRVEMRWVETTDKQQMLTWVVYPPDFDPQKTYPAVLFCTGGPQGTLGQFWSYRWNLQLMAANGYMVVAPNRRGVSGMGQAWKEQISLDYGGQNMRDYLSAIDVLAAEPYVDANRLGCVGASYGGFSVYWLAGNHQKRFKAFIAHCGIFNAESQYLETEELWFENWDMGGPFWEQSNETIQRSYAASPHRFVKNWDTPILCIHGEKDYRILASQGMAAFNAARLLGVPAELLIFPDEGHWINRVQNGILWQRRFFAFLDRWLK